MIYQSRKDSVMCHARVRPQLGLTVAGDTGDVDGVASVVGAQDAPPGWPSPALQDLHAPHRLCNTTTLTPVIHYPTVYTLHVQTTCTGAPATQHPKERNSRWTNSIRPGWLRMGRTSVGRGPRVLVWTTRSEASDHNNQTRFCTTVRIHIKTSITPDPSSHSLAWATDGRLLWYLPYSEVNTSSPTCSPAPSVPGGFTRFLLRNEGTFGLCFICDILYVVGCLKEIGENKEAWESVNSRVSVCVPAVEKEAVVTTS